MKTLSCPFCGEKNEIELTGDYKDYICECSWCGAQSGRGDNEKEAIKNWNTRAEPKNIDSYNSGFIDAKNKIMDMLELIK